MSIKIKLLWSRVLTDRQTDRQTTVRGQVGGDQVGADVSGCWRVVVKCADCSERWWETSSIDHQQRRQQVGDSHQQTYDRQRHCQPTLTAYISLHIVTVYPVTYFPKVIATKEIHGNMSIFLDMQRINRQTEIDWVHHNLLTSRSYNI